MHETTNSVIINTYPSTSSPTSRIVHFFNSSQLSPVASLDTSSSSTCLFPLDFPSAVRIASKSVLHCPAARTSPAGATALLLSKQPWPRRLVRELVMVCRAPLVPETGRSSTCAVMSSRNSTSFPLAHHNPLLSTGCRLLESRVLSNPRC